MITSEKVMPIENTLSIIKPDATKRNLTGLINAKFEKAGLTPIPSETIQPFRVAEAPVQFECRVNEVKELGHEGGAGNLIICEVLRMHVREDLIDEKGLIDQHKIDLVSRMGGDWYVRANESSMFEIKKPEVDIKVRVK